MAVGTQIPFAPFIQETLYKQNTIFSLGLAGLSGNAEITKGGKLIESLYRKNLRDLGRATFIADESTAVTSTTLDVYNEYRPSLTISNAWDESKYDMYAKGETGFNAEFQRQIASYFQEEMTYYAKSILDGNYASGGVLNSTHVQGDGTATITMDAIFEAMGLVGENQNSFNRMVIHPAIKKDLAGYIETANPDSFGDQVNRTGQISTVAGLRLEESSVLCETEGLGVYPCYIYADQSLDFQINPMVSNLEITTSTGGGTVNQQFTTHFAGGVKGTSWTKGSAAASQADLEVTGNYTKTGQDQNIRLVKLLVLAGS